MGKMLIESGLPLNIEYNVLDAADAPARRYATRFIEGKLTDEQKIKALAEISDVITYEIEHINADYLLELEKSGLRVIPSAQNLLIIQNKGTQKQFYLDHGIPTKAFVKGNANNLHTLTILLESIKGNLLVVKSLEGGYDGKGVAIVSRDSLLSNPPFRGDILVEEFSENCRELSVIVAWNDRGDVVTYPVVEMVFDPIMNLVSYLFAPAALEIDTEKRAKDIGIQAITKLNGIGLFAVELFLEPTGEIFVNEIAPRPHNSGHHTIEACYTSQYEQLNRILLDLPLGDTGLIQPVVMTNIIGPDQVSGDYLLEGLEELYSTPGASLHWYNKAETRPGRKMGHFTVMDPILESAITKAGNIAKSLQIVSKSGAVS